MLRKLAESKFATFMNSDPVLPYTWAGFAASAAIVVMGGAVAVAASPVLILGIATAAVLGFAVGVIGVRRRQASNMLMNMGGTVATAGAAVLVATSIVMSGGKPSITVQNESQEIICNVYIVNPDAESWGKDVLGKDLLGRSRHIRPGSSYRWNVDEGYYDVAMQDCDDVPLDEIFKLKVFEGVTLVFNKHNEGLAEIYLQEHPDAEPQEPAEPGEIASSSDILTLFPTSLMGNSEEYGIDFDDPGRVDVTCDEIHTYFASDDYTDSFMPNAVAQLDGEELIAWLRPGDFRVFSWAPKPQAESWIYLASDYEQFCGRDEQTGPQSTAGVITGKLWYPSDFTPASRVVATSVFNGNQYWIDTPDSAAGAEYTIPNLPPDDYVIVAWILDATFSAGPELAWGAYTRYSECLKTKSDCDDDFTLLEVAVRAGQTLTGIDIQFTGALPDGFPFDIYTMPNR